MTPQEMATKLNGREYRKEITRAEEIEAKAAGLAVVFGASDDLVEFRGVFYDEIDAIVFDDGELYCRGIVFALAELGGAS